MTDQELLEAVEWSAGGGPSYDYEPSGYCPVCSADKDRGHYADCGLALRFEREVVSEEQYQARMELKRQEEERARQAEWDRKALEYHAFLQTLSPEDREKVVERDKAAALERSLLFRQMEESYLFGLSRPYPPRGLYSEGLNRFVSTNVGPAG